MTVSNNHKPNFHSGTPSKNLQSVTSKIGAEIWEGDERRRFQFLKSGDSLKTSSLNCLSCRIPCQSLHSLKAWSWFSEKALLFTDFCFIASPSPNLCSDLKSLLQSSLRTFVLHDLTWAKNANLLPLGIESPHHPSASEAHHGCRRRYRLIASSAWAPSVRARTRLSHTLHVKFKRRFDQTLDH